MDSILRHLYFLFGTGAVIFLLTGGVIGYYIGIRHAQKAYKKFADYVENDFMENIKNSIK